MKPLVGALGAWACIVISIFAIIILSIIGSLFKRNHHTVMGSEESPHDYAATASSIFGAVFIYVGCLIFCGSQALLHSRNKQPGQIALS